ncbi:MAG: DUF1292 domain-containing protein [Lachnospiraceae bacterium]|nr:DUF1292 domain-containing protein [Lachnospiraceae bacterium]
MYDTIKVYNDEGIEQEFYVLEQTQLQGVSYLLAVEDIEDEELEAWIFKQVGTDGDEVCYETIDDETELNAISGIFEELLEDYDFE